jgi:hypothetical protein
MNGDRPWALQHRITPSHVTDLVEFSKTVPFSKIPDYILQKTDEKGKLEAKINELNDQKWKLIGDSPFCSLG